MTHPTRRPGRRRPLALLAGVAMLAVVAACGPSVSSSDDAGGGAKDDANVLKAPGEKSPSGEITIWDRSGDLFEVFDAAIDDFNEVYPDIKVNHVAVDVDAKLQNTLTTGTGVPDGVFLDDAKVAGFANYLWDVSGVLEPYRGKIAKQKIDVASTDQGVFGVPFDLDPGLLFYNDAALKKAGVDPSGIETYDDLLAAAKQYQQEVPGSKPIHLEQDAFLGQLQLEMYANQLGTSITDADGKLRLDSPEYQQILGWLDTVQKQGLGTRAEYLKPTDVGAMESGQQVFYPWAMWFSFAPQQLLPKTKGDWRAMSLPAWKDGGARSGAMGGSSFVLPKDGKNADLAWLFYKFLMYDKAGYTAVWGPNKVYPQGLNTSIPAYEPAAEAGTPLFGPVDALGGQDLWKTAVEAGAEIPGGTPTPSWWAGSVDYLGSDLQKMLDGDLTPDEVISSSTDDIQKNLVDRQ